MSFFLFKKKIIPFILIISYFFPVAEIKRNEVLNHKGKLHIASAGPSKWAFDPNTLFERLNLYLIRLHDVYDIIKAANDFFKLEKIEMGSRYLGEKMSTVINEFQTVYNTCIANNSNLLEPSNTKFKHLKTYYHKQIAILERKLSQIFTEAFESSHSIETSIKLVEMIGELLHRPIIKEQLNHQIEIIVENVRNELNMIEDLLRLDWGSAKNMVSPFSMLFIFYEPTKGKSNKLKQHLNFFRFCSAEIVICSNVHFANSRFLVLFTDA